MNLVPPPVLKTNRRQPHLMMCSNTHGLPPLAYGPLFLRLTRDAVAAQILNAICDVEYGDVVNHWRDKFERDLRAAGIREDSLLLIRDKTRNPVNSSKRRENEKMLERIRQISFPMGPAAKIFDVHKPGDILTHGQLLDIIVGSSVPKAAQAEAVIRDLVDHGTLTILPGRNGRSYVLKECLVLLAPCADFIRTEMRKIARRVRYLNHHQHGWPLTLCEHGLVDLTAYLQSPELEKEIGLTRVHTGGVPNYGALLTMAPLAREQSWETAADRAINDTYSPGGEERLFTLSLACLNEEWRRHYAASGASAVYDGLIAKTQQFQTQRQRRTKRPSHGLGLFFADVPLEP